MVGESNQRVSLIQMDASSFAKFEISEFEISRVDCINLSEIIKSHTHLAIGFEVKGIAHSCKNVISNDVTINKVMFWWQI